MNIIKESFTLFFLGGILSVFAQGKPNILIIYTDQQRSNTIHSLGNEQIVTPNLDKLVHEGTAFTNSFVSSPVCTPSRWSLFSGMYTTSHQTYSNHHVSEKRPETSLAIELKKQGYYTVLLGKNHCFLDKTDMDLIDGGKPFMGEPADGRSAEKAISWTVDEDPMHQLTNRALKVLSENSGNNRKPVFMWLSYLYPHTPYLCPEPYFSMYDSIDIPEPFVETDGLKAAGKPFRQQFHQMNNDLLLPYSREKTMRMKYTYYGMISMIDAEIGRILDYLDASGMRKNTIIIFSSDHGDYMGDHGLYTKSPALYDCLVHVPLLISCPGLVTSNQIINELVSSTDLMPTILDLVHAPIPRQVQGFSFVKLLEGEKLSVSRKYVFSEYGIPGKPISEEELQQTLPDWKKHPIDYVKGIPWEANPVGLAGRIRMIRSSDYKLIEEMNGTSEFYDLKADPHELTNRWSDPAYSSIRSEMLKALHKWKDSLPGIERDQEPMGWNNFNDYINGRSKINSIIH